MSNVVRAGALHLVEAEPTSLHADVVNQLRDFIVEGHLSPGSRVPERELCERFKMSRTPLREALKVLAAEGLIDLWPNRGARVRQFSELDIRNLFEMISGPGLRGRPHGLRADHRRTDYSHREIASRNVHALSAPGACRLFSAQSENSSGDRRRGRQSALARELCEAQRRGSAPTLFG